MTARVPPFRRTATGREVSLVFGLLIFIGAVSTTVLIAINSRDTIAVDRATMAQRASGARPGDSAVYAIAAGQLAHLEAQEQSRGFSRGGVLALPGFAALAAGSLVPAPDMSVARFAHTATTLPDGRVLVAGGFTEKGSTKGAEAYDPATGRFIALPPMQTTRHSHTATLLPDGRVLIAGGYGEGTATLATAEVFDPTTNTFSPTGSLTAPRAGHVAVLLRDGRVLLAGGLGPGWTFLSSAELYDPATGRFSAAGNMTVARESHVGVRLRDGRVLIVGGHRGRRADITLFASAELFDPATGAFSRTGDMRVPRHKHDGVLLPDGRVLVTGGSDERDDRGVFDSSELYDPATGTFSAGPRMMLGRYKHAGSSVLLRSGLVLIAGGAPRAET